MIAYRPNEAEKILDEEGFDLVEINPVVTRLPFHYFFPPLRKKGTRQNPW